MKRYAAVAIVTITLTVVFSACSTRSAVPAELTTENVTERPATAEVATSQVRQLLESAQTQLKTTRQYTQDYYRIPYPNGDLPTETGACTDVIVRSFRNAGVDLQREVHEDMAANFASYPKKWGLSKPDTNIDHRRVPNLHTFFTRHGKSLPVGSGSEKYKPGDVITWDLDGKGMTHIGLVSNLWNEKTKRYLIIHNIGGGVNAEDRMFEWKITGHFRFF